MPRADLKQICVSSVFHLWLNKFMRITGGNAARRILKVPKGLDVRPTPDLVKQAIFNSLSARVVGATVLELFAGSGALSLECLSRGAVSALCIERSQKHANFIQQNAAQISNANLQVRTQDVFTALAQLVGNELRLDGVSPHQQFDLILADPPYGEKNVNRRSQSFAQQLLDDKNLPKLLAPGGRFVLGHTKRDTLEIFLPWTEVKMLKHGDTVMRFLEL
jgi:16S rRNA (guanine966-N2)-methyltransferase